MTVTNGYCTVADLRGHLGDSGNTLDQTVLERAINASSRAIDRYCSRRFWQDPAPTVRQYRPETSTQAWVDDISTTTGLVVKTDWAGNGSFSQTLTIGTDFQLLPLNADKDNAAFAWWELATLGYVWFPQFWNRPTLQVTAQFGWAAVPDEVNEACILKAAALFKRKDAPFGIAGFGEFGAVRISRQDPDVASLLAPFVNTWMA